MKRIACILAAAAMAFLLAGCGGAASSSADKPADQGTEKQQSAQSEKSASDEQQADSQDKSDAADTDKENPGASNVPVSGKKWQYAYTGDEGPYLTAVCEFLAQRDAEYYDISDGMIPAIEVVKIDDDDPQDIKVFGVFEIRNYELKNKTLHLKSGGTDVGVIHLKKEGDGYVATKGEFAEDGAGYDESLEKLCKGYDGLYDDMIEAIVPDKVRKLYMKECIEAFDLDVEKYQDIGEDPMPIEEWLSYSFD